MKIAKVLKDFPCDSGFLAAGQEHEVFTGAIVAELHYALIRPSAHPSFFSIEERPDGPWKPKLGEGYFYIGSNLSVYRVSNAIWTDKSVVDISNCYRTEAEALAHVPAVRRAYQGKTLQEVIESKFTFEEGSMFEGHAREIIAAWEAR
jgi:hypothetical protein